MPTPLNPEQPVPEFDSPDWQDRENYLVGLTLLGLSYNVPGAFNVHPLSTEGRAAATRVLQKCLAQMVVTFKGRLVSVN